MTLRETVLGNTSRTRIKIDVPEWNGVSVWVAPMTAREQFQLTTLTSENPDVPQSAYVVAICAEDEAGKKIFTPDDAESLGDLPNGDAIGRIALAVTGMHKSVEELRKN